MSAVLRLRRAIEFLDGVRSVPANDRPAGVMRDALRDLEEAAREVVVEAADRNCNYTDIVSDGGIDPRDRALTEFYTDRANGCHAAKAP